MVRAQAIVDDDVGMILLCDVALGRRLEDRDLDRIPPEAAQRYLMMRSGEARAELHRTDGATIAVGGR
jgi:hypothetical protein